LMEFLTRKWSPSSSLHYAQWSWARFKRSNIDVCLISAGIVEDLESNGADIESSSRGVLYL
jgi:hypothetical protein